jgi:hypothetical protein
MGAHRVAKTLQLGHPLTPEQLCCHKCDNPKCCNPMHMFIGSTRDNALDSRDKGRHYQRKTHCPAGHPYSPESSYVTAKGARACRECGRINAAKYSANKRAKS